jgi:hypothetical protein
VYTFSPFENATCQKMPNIFASAILKFLHKISFSKMMMCNKFVFTKSWPFYYEKSFVYPICGKYMVESIGYD